MSVPTLDQHLANGVRYRLTEWPETGWFKIKLVRKGPWIPAVIWRPCPLILPDKFWGDGSPAPEDWCQPTERSRPLRARIGDDEADPLRVWHWGLKITAREYHWRMALKNWAAAAGGPEATPRQAIDLSGQPALFRPRFEA